jgi:hypothetical protein
MSQIINIYCDESCHLENDKKNYMVLGAVWCPLDKLKEINKRIRDIKAKHNMTDKIEIKWNKVSPGKISFYLDLIDFFFDYNDLHFRALIADKTKLDHDKFLQSHDEWYYKMFFTLLKFLLIPTAQHKIFLDIKDTRGGSRIANLKEVLCNNILDFQQRMIPTFQLIQSKEVLLIQIADLLIGAVSAENRNETSSEAKKNIISRIKERSKYCLTKTTLYSESKFNILKWQPLEE